MKTSIITISKVITTMIAGALVAACGLEAKSITGSGNVITTNRNITEEFTGIAVEKGLEVVVEQSDQMAVMIEADDNLQPYIKTTVANGTLNITSDYGNYINVTSKKVIVRMPLIKGLSTSSGAALNSKNALRSENIALKSSSGSEINVALEADIVNCETSSGSQITVSGKALKLNTKSSSGSNIDATALLVNDVDSESSSASVTKVHPIMSLKAKASSASSIDYQGDPHKIDKKESSGGSVAAE